MATLNEFPKVMSNARTDLSANVRGRFSPEDWDKILVQARDKWVSARQSDSGGEAGELRAWETVIVDFYRNRYWGFEPNYNPDRDPNVRKSPGVWFLWTLFFTFTITIMAVVWLGQRFTASDEPRDTYLFVGVIALVVLNFAFFLWTQRNHRD